ncbi:unnamed protein product [Rotaria sp. Silwood1]|nr:unnamed protein product [Rotaria sp. Silwood1]CAF3656019.1 unnamed protein product [Rotaria sp. Silwood1]CAF3659492.1 unnamed protein product [Rotaria sp. Silwood1]CAF4667844.1 unnamed protein product [Rotaria sp. Silwood1]CAF4763770.1 unnamed protein product [Rotaria sp. Silwood1]
MLDRDNNHIKLIDFGFAFAFNIDNKGGFPYYFYERTFDLICALNIIMAISNADIKRSIDSFKNLQDVNEVVLKSWQLRKDMQRINKYYSNLLNLINKLDSWYPLNKSDESSVSDVSKGQSAIFDVIKDEIENFSICEQLYLCFYFYIYITCSCHSFKNST